MRCQSLNILLFFLLILFSVSSCQKEVDRITDNREQNITIRFKPVVSGQELIYGSDYSNTAGEAFSVRAFKIADNYFTMFSVKRVVNE